MRNVLFTTSAIYWPQDRTRISGKQFSYSFAWLSAAAFGALMAGFAMPPQALAACFVGDPGEIDCNGDVSGGVGFSSPLAYSITGAENGTVSLTVKVGGITVTVYLIPLFGFLPLFCGRRTRPVCFSSIFSQSVSPTGRPIVSARLNGA